MIPAFFVSMDSLPFTASNKIDRKALPDQGRLRQESEENLVLPFTKIQIQLAKIWKTVLQFQGDIGIHDNFFNLGGHSLLATQVISRINEQYNIQLPLRKIFDYPTILTLEKEIKKVLALKSLTLTKNSNNSTIKI